MNEPSADGSLPTNKPGHRDKTGGSGRVAEEHAPAPARFPRIGPSSEAGRLSQAKKRPGREWHPVDRCSQMPEGLPGAAVKIRQAPDL